MRDLLLKYIQLICDFIFAIIPRKLKSNKTPLIVAHRGTHSAKVKENTMEAFQKSLELGLWGIELDIQWTKDQVPVVHHDFHCGRVLLRPEIVISEYTASEIKQTLPELPLFSEVLSKFGQKLHLMIELKQAPSREQEIILKELLSDLQPDTDFHLLCLDPRILSHIVEFPKTCFVGVSELNSSYFREFCRLNHWGGYTTHYLLLSDQQIQESHNSDQKVGVGYIASKNSLHREVNRNIDWIFTNTASKLVETAN